MIEQTNIQTAPKRQSRLGIASVIIGLSLPVLLVFFIVSGVLMDTKKGTVSNDILLAYLLISLTFPFLHLLALIFGLIGAFSKKTKSCSRFPARSSTVFCFCWSLYSSS